MMDKRIIPILHIGYQPLQVKEVEANARLMSASQDILRVGANSFVKMSEVRRAQDFVKRCPLNRLSKGRTVIINLDKCDKDIQNALLRLVEEPPLNVQIILYAESELAILSTIMSRVRCVKYIAGEYGQKVRDFVAIGLDSTRAAQVASLVDRGYSIDTTPLEQDYNTVSVLIESAKLKDIETGVRVAQFFTHATLNALREQLINFKALVATYATSNPVEAAMLSFYLLLTDRDYR